MAAPHSTNTNMDQSYQSITVRNSRGEAMIQSALNSGRLELGAEATGKGTHENFAMATVSSDNIVQQMVGGEIKMQGMPRFLGEVMATVTTNVGPKGISFARYSLDYHILRNYLHCLDFWGEETANKMLPTSSLRIVHHYLETKEAFRKLTESIMSKR
jgi:hypothetical protein